MEKTKLLITSLLWICLIGISRADNPVDLTQENSQLKQRVDKLEKEVEELKKLIMQQQKPETVVQPPTSALSPAPAKPAEVNVSSLNLSEAERQKLMAMLQKETTTKKPVWADLDIQLYGAIKADASFDSSRSNPGNYILWVNSDRSNDHGRGFNLTANQTKFGARINGPDDGNIKSSGLVEIDFYGNAGNPPENKPEPMVRHAYLNIDWQQQRFSILAGQTSDVISPLWPETLNYTVLWDAGNIGYRRPQIRLTKICGLNKDTDLKFEVAAARTIGRTDQINSTTLNSESGANEGWPTLQARTSVTFPWCGYKPTTIGVSGHYGKEEFDLGTSSPAVETGKRNFQSWSLNLDVLQPVTSVLTIKGELFTGENLGTYFGGIGQSVRAIPNTTNNFDKEIGAKGGWVAATLGPWDKIRFNIGAGIDDVDSDDINVGDRSLNRSIFGNVIYAVNKNTEVGFELSQWRTAYKGPGDADSVRAQTSLIYKF